MSVWHRLFSGFSLSLSSLLSFHFSVSGTVGGVFTRLELLASLASSLLWAGDGRCFEEKQLLEDSFLAGLLYRFPSGEARSSQKDNDPIRSSLPTLE